MMASLLSSTPAVTQAGVRSTSVGGASSSLVIEELGVSSPRKLVLVGSGLPNKPASWAGSTAITTTWYQGNPVGTQQVLGPREDPSTWGGTWARTMLSRSPARWTNTDGVEVQVVQPRILRDALTSLRVGGALLRVTWASDGNNDNTQDRIVREGRLQHTEFQVFTVYDIGWSAKFDWVSSGQAKSTPISTREDSFNAASSAFEVANSAIDVMAALNRASNSGILHSADNFSLGQLEAFVAGPTNAINALQHQMHQTVVSFNRFLTIANNAVRAPYDTMQAMATLARATQTTADSYMTTQGRIPVELLTNKLTAASVLRTHAYYAQVSDAVIKTARAAAAIALRFALDRPRVGQRREDPTVGAQQNDANVLAVHKVKQGDTPSRLSVTYYGSPDFAWLICRANRLPWQQVTLPLGALLTIPVLNSTSVRT